MKRNTVTNPLNYFVIANIVKYKDQYSNKGSMYLVQLKPVQAFVPLNRIYSGQLISNLDRTLFCFWENRTRETGCLNFEKK